MRIKFDNGHGASIIPDGSTGQEVAILSYDRKGQSFIDYSTPITDDVVRTFTANDLAALLARIATLPAR
jgi:hypothetical protein